MRENKISHHAERKIYYQSIIQSRNDVCPSLKISVTIKPIGFYYSGIIPTGPVVVLGYFLGAKPLQARGEAASNQKK